MLETSKEIRHKKWRERADGSWFPFTTNKYLKAIEVIGQSIAFSIRSLPMVRKSIGADTCKLLPASLAFVWFQIWVAGSIGLENSYCLIFTNPFTLDCYEAYLLSFLSYHMLVRFLVIKANWGFKSAVINKDTDSSNRGESLFFDMGDNSGKLIGKKWAKQVLFEPASVALLGFLLYNIEGFEHAGLFFLISSVLHLLDEANHHVAKGIIAEEERKAKIEAEKKAEFHEGRDS